MTYNHFNRKGRCGTRRGGGCCRGGEEWEGFVPLAFRDPHQLDNFTVNACKFGEHLLHMNLHVTDGYKLNKLVRSFIRNFKMLQI